MSVRRSVVWMLASQGGLLVLQFGGSMALARLLTPYEMGVYAVAAAIVGIITIIQAFGLTLLIVREAEISADLLATAFTINALLAAGLALAVVGLSEFGGALLREPGVRNVMLVLAPIPLIGIFELLPSAHLERAMQFRTLGVIGLLRSVASTGVTLALAFAGFSYMSIAWGAMAGAVTSAAANMVAGHQYVSFPFGFTAWRRVLRFGVSQIAVQGVQVVAQKLSELLLGRLLGLSALGLYGRASSLNWLLWYNIHMLIGRVVMVDLARQRRLGHSLRDRYLRTLELLMGLLWPGYAGLAILAGPFIRVVYGSRWVAAAAPLAALSVSAMLLVSLAMTWEMFIVCNETGRQARFEFIRAAVGVVLFAGGCFVGLTAAAATRIVEALFAVALYRPHMERMTETRWADYAPRYRRNAIVTVAACGPAFALMMVYHWSSQAPLGLVVGAVAAGVGTWLVALRATGHPLSEEIAKVFAKARALATLGP
jgi:O-antigen/teichoic acid export membrane protein